MARKTTSNSVNYFDVIAGLIALYVGIASFLIAVGHSETWKNKDSVEFGLFLFVMTTFILFLSRRMGKEHLGSSLAFQHWELSSWSFCSGVGASFRSVLVQ